jgi:kynurenine formamidase
MRRSGVIVTAVAMQLIASSPAFGQPPAANRLAVPRDTFVAWMATLSNAGRWGKQDQLGTLNLITPAIRRGAAQRVRDGVSISMASDVLAGPGREVMVPMRFNLETIDEDSLLSYAIDSIMIVAHGFSSSHIDALSHVMFRGHLYNGFTRDQLKPNGASVLGIETMHAGLVTRGVLVDMPWLAGVDFMRTGEGITPADMERLEERTGVRVQPGDVLLLRTGRWVRARMDTAWVSTTGTAGPHPSLARWLKDRGVAALGSDATDMFPSAVPGISLPMHILTIVALGMPLLDNLDLDAVAAYAASHRRPTFLFVAMPLRIRGATSSLLNPVAVF